jgi:CMP/dCMP kinase
MLDRHIPPVIAIDGPSASGKGTVAQKVAQKLGFHYLDSGALYRIVAYSCQQQGIAWDDEITVTAYAKTLNICFSNDKVLVNNADVTEAIRTETIGKGASIVAVHPTLRAALLSVQRALRQSPGLVGDGRDIGTVIFPDAVLKIFLTASTEVRAERRYRQLLNKQQTVDYPAILQDLQLRDTRDSTRTSAPLLMADDAVLLETDNLGIEEAVASILQQFEAKKSK